MRIIIIYLFWNLTIGNLLFSQENPKVFLSFGDHFSYGIRDQRKINSFQIKSGLEFEHVCGLLTYSYGGQFDYKSRKFNNYRYQAIGLGLKYNFTKKYKVKPFFSIELSSEISSNYKNGLLRYTLEAVSQVNTSLSELSDQYNRNFSTYEEYDAWVGNVYYQSTALIYNFLIGSDFSISKGFNLNLGIGAGIRNIKIKKPISNRIENNWIVTFDAQLSLSYSIPLKKKVE